jgi:hypothetical protein
MFIYYLFIDIESEGKVDMQEDSIDDWINNNRNANTYTAYQKVGRMFSEYIHERKIDETKVDDTVVAEYIRHLLVVKRHSYSTIKNYIHSLEQYWQMNPRLAHLCGTTSKFKSKQAKNIAKAKAPASISKLPITTAILEELALWYFQNKSSKAKEKFRHARDICLMVLMTAGMLRESEATALTMDDVSIESLNDLVNNAPVKARGGLKEKLNISESNEAVILKIGKTKTNQSNQVQVRALAGQVENNKHKNLCPVLWVREYERMLKKAEVVRRPDNRTSMSYFFVIDRGDKLKENTPSGIIQKMVKIANENYNLRNEQPSEYQKFKDPSCYGSHSCRHGGATSAHAEGVDMVLIKKHGNWKSDAVLVYVQPLIEEQLTVTSFLSNSISSPVRHKRKPSQLDLEQIRKAARLANASENQ